MRDDACGQQGTVAAVAEVLLEVLLQGGVQGAAAAGGRGGEAERGTRAQ